MTRPAPRLLTLLLLTLAGWCTPRARAAHPEPPDTSAAVTLQAGMLTVGYAGAPILSGAVRGKDVSFTTSTARDPASGALTQETTLTSADGKPIDLDAVLAASPEAFPCQADPNPRDEPIVRHSVGLSVSRLNRAVYDRRGDWVLSVGEGSSCRVLPLAPNGAGRGQSFHLTARGPAITLTFRPRFYQKHRGLKLFEPWNSPLWDKPVVGWCSWFAYLDKVTEADVRRTTDVLSRKLAPYGLTYIQIDDGYQQAPAGLPETWLQANSKFPAGLPGLSSYIREHGLTPALWLASGFLNNAQADANPDLFLKNPAGGVARGNWVGSVPDYSKPAVLDRLVHQLYRPLHQMGWRYIKLDSLRHLRYEGFNSFPESFNERGLDRVKVYRDYVKTVKDDLGGPGGDTFLLACWGVRPELAGVADGCRLATDGFRWGCLAQYNSFNNVVWRNDPDHIQLKPGLDYPSCLVTSITGSLFMVTDPAERYEAPDLDCVMRSIPVLVTRPGQIYDVDPSRSSRIAEADTCRDGGPPTPFDGVEKSVTSLFLQELNTPYENWVILGQLAPRAEPVRFASLGLNPDAEHLVFDVWANRLVGSFKGAFTPPAIDPRFACNLFCIREKLARPQLLATSRHISGGAFDVSSLQWTPGQGGAGVLSGTSTVVAGAPYEVFIHEPAGTPDGSAGAATPGVQVLRDERLGEVRKVTLLSPDSRPIEWTVQYGGKPAPAK